MTAWEQRAKKLLSRRRRMPKHGRSILSTLTPAQREREQALANRARKRSAARARPSTR